MPQSNLALILDTETTGNEEDSDLIEIGLVMLDVPSLSELGAFTIVIEPSAEQFTEMVNKKVVKEMHEANGLMRDLMNHRGVPPEVADAAICHWLDQYSTDRGHIPYGGSGVSHFDRKYITRQLPMLNRRITYWALDVGAARRIFALQGASTHSIDAKTHRALDDAQVHADELRFYAEAGRLADQMRRMLGGEKLSYE